MKYTTCDRCRRRVPVMAGMSILACAHVDYENRPCLDGPTDQPWLQYRPRGGAPRYAQAYLGVPGQYDPGPSLAAARAEWDL